MVTKPRGTQDFLPDRVAQWTALESRIRELCAAYGYGELRTPSFENTSLFLRGIGETTDIVQKEMYTFQSGEKGDSYTLRPEGTASAVRAYIENKIYGVENLTKWFYVGPMFRHDRPQAGRYRQFHQLGVEVLGSESPYMDAEVINLVIQLFTDLGLQDLNVELNSVGCPTCRPTYRQALIDYFEPHRHELCEDCQERLDKNPLRVLDCKIDGPTALGEGAPNITDYLCEECHDHFEVVKQLLTDAGVHYHLNPRLVSGLDYYTKTAFEVQYTPLGSQSAIAGGGRYDGLVHELGGPVTPGVGFAAGLERVILTLEKQGLLPAKEPTLDIFIVALGEKAKKEAYRLQQVFRKSYIAVEMDGEGKSMKSQLKYANKKQAKYVIILGDDELARQEATLRFMESSEQEAVPMAELETRLTALVKGC